MKRGREQRFDSVRLPAEDGTGASRERPTAWGPDATAEDLQARIRQLEQLVSLGLTWVLQAPAVPEGTPTPATSRTGAPSDGETTAPLQTEIRRLELLIAALEELETRRQQVQTLRALLQQAAAPLPDPASAANGSVSSERTADAWRAGTRTVALGDLPEQPGVERAPLAAPARPAGSGSVAAQARRWSSELFQFLLLTLVGFLAFRSTIQTFRVDGPSMLPTFQTGQVLLINRAVYFHVDGTPLEGIIPTTRQGSIAYLFGGVKRGDVVIFHAPVQRNTDYIKRVIGLPGDTILLRDGQVIVNGRPLSESYLYRGEESAESYPDEDAPLTVPDGMYFVLGDNRPVSFDSREGWLLPVENLVGRPWLSVWPPDTWGVVAQPG